MTDKEEFNHSPYGTKSTSKALKHVEGLKLNGYVLLDKREGHKKNFFIWQRMKDKKPKSEYIRLALISSGWHEKTVFYWNLEPCFKPFSKKYNENIQSETFKGKDIDKYHSYLLNMLDRLRFLEK